MFSMTLVEFLALFGIAVSGAWALREITVEEGAGLDETLSKNNINLIRNIKNEIIGCVDYYTDKIEDVASNATTTHNKTIAAMASIHNNTDKINVDKKSIIDENGNLISASFSTMNKSSVVLTAASMFGLNMSEDVAKELTTDSRIDWDKYTLKNTTNKVLTMLSSDAKSNYIPTSLLNSIKNVFIEKGYYNNVVKQELPEASVKYTYKININDFMKMYLNNNNLQSYLNDWEGCYNYLKSNYTQIDFENGNVLCGITGCNKYETENHYETVFYINILSNIDTFIQTDFDYYATDDVTGCVESKYDSTSFIVSTSTLDSNTAGKLVFKVTSNYNKNNYVLSGGIYRKIHKTTGDITYLFSSDMFGVKQYGEISVSDKYIYLSLKHGKGKNVSSGFKNYSSILNFGTLVDKFTDVSKQNVETFPTTDETVKEYLDTIPDAKKQASYKVTDDNESIALTPTKPALDVETIPQSSSISDVDDDTAQKIIDEITDVISDVIVDNPPLPTPSYPPIGSISLPNLGPIFDTGFVGIYNPSVLQLRNFSGWLWSTDFLDFDVVKKMFQNPFDCIIGLHAIYCSPEHISTSTIKCGRLDSNITSYVAKQYVDVDCGTKKISRYFDNARDYQTNIEIFLPFVGIQQISTEDILDKNINVKYRIDVLTGTGVCVIYVDNQPLYHYSCNCSVQIPISGTSYNSIMGGILGGIGGLATSAAAIASGVVTANPAVALGVAAAGGAITGSVNNMKNGRFTGSLGANAGSLDNKKPYLIITRHVPYDAINRERYEGLPCNVTRNLAKISGFTQIRNINLNNLTCSIQEQEELKEIMSEGIIL